MLSYGVSINLTNVGEEGICSWKDGWSLKTDASEENEERERSS